MAGPARCFAARGHLCVREARAISDLHSKLTRFYAKVMPEGGTPPRSPQQIRMLAHHFVGNRSDLEAKLAEKYKTNLAELSDDDGGGGTAAASEPEV